MRRSTASQIFASELKEIGANLAGAVVDDRKHDGDEVESIQRGVRRKEILSPSLVDLVKDSDAEFRIDAMKSMGVHVCGELGRRKACTPSTVTVSTEALL